MLLIRNGLDLRHESEGLVAVGFGVNLRRERCAVTEHDPRQFDAVLFAEHRRGVVTKLVRMPAGNFLVFVVDLLVGSHQAVFDRLAVGHGRVVILWRSLRSRLPLLLLVSNVAWPQRRLAFLTTLFGASRSRFGRREQIRLQVRLEPRAQDGLTDSSPASAGASTRPRDSHSAIKAS